MSTVSYATITLFMAENSQIAINLTSFIAESYGEEMLKMAIEQYTESLTLKEMKCAIGKNSFGYVFPQGDVSDIDKIEKTE